MDFLVIFKWCTEWTHDPSLAPSIINTMIDIPLKAAGPIDFPLWGDGVSQHKIQVTFLCNF
jgi:hypothetical protein